MKMPWLVWIPRAIIMAFALFTVIFSIDSFEGSRPLWEKLGGFMIHNIFFFVLSFVLVATWYRPLIAGILFFMFSVAMTVLFHSRWQFDTYLLIAGPPVLVAILYMAVYFKDRTKALS